MPYLKCSYCNYWFSTIEGLKKHIKDMHPDSMMGKMQARNGDIEIDIVPFDGDDTE